VERRLRETLDRWSDSTEDLLRAARGGDLGALDGALARRRLLLEHLPGQLRAEDDAGRQACRAILAQLLETDREIEAILEQKRDEMGAELAAIGHGRRGLSGYRAGGQKSAKWIDERG
jgi:hypothetical protein